MAYATAAQLLARKDARRVGELVSDQDRRVSPGDLLTDAVLQAALDDASGEVEAACRVGRKYDPADLAALAGNAQAFLVRLTVELAYGFLLQRRGYNEADTLSQAPGFKRALETLAALKDGSLAFGVDANLDAGLPVNVQLSKQLTLITSAADRYFGSLDANPNFIPR